MLRQTSLILFLFLIPALGISQDLPQHEFDIDLTEFCRDQEIIDTNASEVKSCAVPELDKEIMALTPVMLQLNDVNGSKKATCAQIMSMSDKGVPPIEMELKDDKGNPWKIKFHFGFTRTNIRPTDIKIESSKIHTTIKGYEFDERTSGQHYNPKTWEEFQDGFRWIDEPSNTFTISIENKNNAIYITAYHPKFLKTYYEKTDESGDKTYSPQTDPTKYLSEGTPKSFAAIPEGQSGFEIQNTHMLMNYQIGYGRKFDIVESEKLGKLTYIARADVGVTVGGARTIYIDESRQWHENRDALGVQGFNASLGHRVEYQKGKVGLFVEQKYTTSKLEHGVLDGKASYKLDYSTITFGANVDLYTMSDKDKDKARAQKMKEDDKKKLNSLDQK